VREWRNMLTCSEIKNSVHEYNSGQAFRHDLALKAALTAVQTLSPCAARFLAEICVVADWGSIPRQIFPFEMRIAMAAELENVWPLLASLRTLSDTD